MNCKLRPLCGSTVLLLLFALFSPYANAQTGEVTGKIKDDKGAPLSGVTVLAPKSGRSTLTKGDGSYKLPVTSADDSLTFSFVGFASSTLAIDGKATVSLALTPTSSTLSDVVVVGYGTQKKKAVTGSVVSVGYDQFKDRSFSNVAQSLEGTIAGVNITTNQGAPGYGPSIKIRGTSSITAGATPLYVIDGMALENFDLGQINPQDIQSVDILKDAASSAIYGSRGANGVILVTTKLGKSGKPAVSFTYEHGLQRVNRKVDMMDAQQWIQYYIDARNNAWVQYDPINNKASDPNSARLNSKIYMIPPDFLTNPAQFGKGTDWQDVVFRTAQSNNVQLSLSGGNDKTSYLFSAGYLDQDAVVIQNFFKRITLRTNIRQKLSNMVTIGLNTSFSGSYDRTDGTSGKSDAISLAIQSDPIFPEYNENGNLGFLDPKSALSRFQTYGVQLWNPHSLIDYADKLNKSYNTLANEYVEVKPIKELTLRGSLSANLSNSRNTFYWVTNQGYGYSSLLPGQGSARSLYSYNWQAEATASYDKTFGEHTLGLLAGYSSQKQRYDSTAINGSDYPNDLVRTINAAGTVTKPAVGNGSSEWSLLSMLARASYSYRNKYFLNATIRRDGSSRFGPNSKWGMFPSVSAGWQVGDESFMQSVKAVSNLKLRLSYGQTGNNLIPNYGYISTLTGSKYVNGTTVVNGLRVNSIANPNLKWEKTNQFNLGLDLGLFQNRINVVIDAYKSVTNDMLLNVPVPAYTGFTTQLTNIGKMENKGIELSINSRNIVAKSFRWSTDFNISLNRNKVLKLGPNNAAIDIDEWGNFITEVGQPISNYKGYIFDGVYQNQAQINNSVHYAGAAPGDPIVRNLNKDNVINADDRTILGNSQPNYTAGLTNTISSGAFELSFMLHGIFGNEIWNQQTRYSKFWNDSRNAYASTANYWKSEQDPGDGKTFKPYASYAEKSNPSGKATYINGYSNYWMEDGTFVRIKNIRLSYTVPTSVTKKTPFKNARIYVNAENVYVFSKYPGFDPENSTYSVGSSSSPGDNGGSKNNAPGLLLGADYGAYPIPFTITVGAKFDF